MRIDDLVKDTGEWLKGVGPESKIVISSRVRLARNLVNYRFNLSADKQEKEDIIRSVCEALERVTQTKKLFYYSVDSLSSLDRRFLVERHLISREHEEGEGARGILISRDETISIMINEEDHLRLQALQSGLQLEQAYAMLKEFDDQLGKMLPFAFDEELGYLTSCPTNVGTGLRASVMVHLPALVMTRHIEKAFRAIAKLNLTVRGLYGEGTEAHGDFYQISNQVTIGRSEEAILGDLGVVIDQIVAYESSARSSLLKKENMVLEDRIWRSYGILKHARIISSEEAMRHLSTLRLASNLNILNIVSANMLNQMFIMSQPAHLQKLENKELAAAERDIVRASLIRKSIKNEEKRSSEN